MIEDKHTKLVSFVHGYGDDVWVKQGPKPGLVSLVSGQKPKFFEFTFPRNVEEFENLEYTLKGEKPLDNAKNFETLPRFGLTGLSCTETHIFAGSWNGVYRLAKKDLTVEAFVTNRLMNDLHGIYVNDEFIVSVLLERTRLF